MSDSPLHTRPINIDALNTTDSAGNFMSAPGAYQGPTRTESDSLGSLAIPRDAYWGVHTARALENFPIARRPISVFPELIRALACVKLAAARANAEIGSIEPEKAEVIERVCHEIIDGKNLFH